MNVIFLSQNQSIESRSIHNTNLRRKMFDLKFPNTQFTKRMRLPSPRILLSQKFSKKYFETNRVELLPIPIAARVWIAGFRSEEIFTIKKVWGSVVDAWRLKLSAISVYCRIHDWTLVCSRRTVTLFPTAMLTNVAISRWLCLHLKKFSLKK